MVIRLMKAGCCRVLADPPRFDIRYQPFYTAFEFILDRRVLLGGAMMNGKQSLHSVFSVLFVVAAVVAARPFSILAQDGTRPPAKFGDPPGADLIEISAPDEEGRVIIRGQAGAVFPGAVVAIRNMYTGETVYPRAEITGAFVGQLYGPGNTPFWISPATRVEPFERETGGSQAGGPGVIVYGPLPDVYAPPAPLPPPESEFPPTPVVVDGFADDWQDITEGLPIELRPDLPAVIHATANTESLYIVIAPADPALALPAEYARLTIGLEAAGRAFLIAVDPRRGGSGRLYDVSIEGRPVDLGPLGALSAQQMISGGAVELRVPRLAFTGWAAPIVVRSLHFEPSLQPGEDDIVSNPVTFALDAAERDEVDDMTGSIGAAPRGAVLFTLSGAVGGGTGTWHAHGWVSQSNLEPGDDLVVEMQVVLNAPEMPGDGADLRLGATLALEPVTVNGAQNVADRHTGNGWSGILTRTGLPVENIGGGVRLGDVAARNLVIQDGVMTFTLRWELPLDEAIPAGLYTPSMQGFAAVTGLFNSWEVSGVLGSGPGTGVKQVRLPVMLQVGDAAGDNRLVWTLFQDNPSSSGARGVLPREDAGLLGVSSRVGFSGERYILPRVDPQTGELIPYPLEPYLPAMLGNSNDETISPLIPFDPVSGEVTVSVTGPDGAVDDLGSVSMLQNMLSTSTRIEARAVGASSPLDVYRLTTLDPRLMGYTFEQDGHYVINVTGTIHDVWGNAYSGGGTYDVWLASPLQMMPGVLPGTPFEVGDIYNPSLTISPAFPADVSVRMQVFPLDGGASVVYETTGQASFHGYFNLDRGAEVWEMTTPGEYVVDIVASYTDTRGNLWMGSVRGAGVIASQQGTLIARGGRGLANAAMEDRLAWYAVDRMAPELLALDPSVRMRWPYHSGDVIWVEDQIGRLSAVLRLTDNDGAYGAWLSGYLPDWRADDGMSVAELANEDELPLVTVSAAGSAFGPALIPAEIISRSYAYISAVRPGIALRQFVLGDETPGVIEPGWDLDDPYNYQRGAGLNGDLPGDYAYLFGGVVVENEALDLQEAAIYGSVMVVTEPGGPTGSRVYPPLRGAANGPDGGPLLTIGDQELTMFFTSTGFQPGQVFSVGDSLAVGGQVAPALAASVQADIVMPSGRILSTGGRANAVGYYYDPTQALTLSEPGIWRIRVRVTYDGVTSAGAVQPPYPSGTVPGATLGEFAVYVLPDESGVVSLQNPLFADGYLPTALPFNITAVVPSGWRDVRMHYTVLMSGIILDSGEQPAYGDIYAYNFDPRRLSRTFPNLDVALSVSQAATTADAVRIALVLSGTDEHGDLVMQARTVLMSGDRFIALHDDLPPPE